MVENTDQLIEMIEAQRALMIAVATAGPRIQQVDTEYRARRLAIVQALRSRGLQDPNPYEDLWKWYGKWSSGDLPTYRSRREYIADLYCHLLDGLQSPAQVGTQLFVEPTGWDRVDRQIDSVRQLLEAAKAEDDFQAVGHRCREVVISLAQAVFDPTRHPPLDKVVPSPTDAKRMLDAYIAVELAGSHNEHTRKMFRAAYDLAVELQHRRTAGFRDAALCAEATISAVNLASIVAGRRDP
jgi:hypothetical protein